MSNERRRLAAYVFLVGLIAVLFFLQGRSFSERERDTRNAARATCEDTNRARATLRLLATRLVDADGLRTPLDQRSLALVNSTLAPIDCNQRVKP